jgi:hypothetical protein
VVNELEMLNYFDEKVKVTGIVVAARWCVVSDDILASDVSFD